MHVVEMGVSAEDLPDLGKQPYLNLIVDVTLPFHVFENRDV